MAEYLTTDTELTSIADAIRLKGGTNSPLVYPAGFISAIDAIETGGGNEYESVLMTRQITEYVNDDLELIGPYAFAYCLSLSKVTLPNIISVGAYAFYMCMKLTDVSIPNCQKLGVYTFQYCSSLRTLTLPKVTSLPNYAFDACDSLYSLYLPGSSLVSLYTYGLAGSPLSINGNSAKVYVPASMLANYQAASNWSRYKGKLSGI